MKKKVSRDVDASSSSQKREEKDSQHIRTQTNLYGHFLPLHYSPRLIAQERPMPNSFRFQLKEQSLTFLLSMGRQFSEMKSKRKMVVIPCTCEESNKVG